MVFYFLSSFQDHAPQALDTIWKEAAKGAEWGRRQDFDATMDHSGWLLPVVGIGIGVSSRKSHLVYSTLSFWIDFLLVQYSAVYPLYFM
jgi:hypothetical protein